MPQHDRAVLSGDRARRHQPGVRGPRPASVGIVLADRRAQRGRGHPPVHPIRAGAQPPARSRGNQRLFSGNRLTAEAGARDPGADGYQSNSWRQARPQPHARSASRRASSRPSSGLDPALKAHADRTARRGPAVRVRLSPAARPARTGRSRRRWPASVSSSSAPRRPPQGPPAGRDRSRRSPRCPTSSGSG